MIQLNSVHLQRGKKVLLEGANLTIYPAQRWGLIGPNGAGKTSIFKLFLRELEEDKGSFAIPKDWQISHMGQELGPTSKTALKYILDGDQELTELQDKINRTQDGDKLGHLYEKMDNIDGYTAEARAHQLLAGLGFKPGDDVRAVNDFSGGWRIRLNLAQALMCRSDFLLLDEPTNHLDLDATYWLESWLQAYKGTLLIISHDRDFLDNVVENIVSIESQKLESYSGNYTQYEMQKAERLAQQSAIFQKQQERVAEIEDFVRRFRAKATKAKQAQSRLKELQRMELIAPAHIDSPFTFRFPKPEKIPQVLINLSEASIGYSDSAPLATNIEFSISGSSRIGLLGSNGAGKTTLIKTLANDLGLLSGQRSEGAHLKIGYFAQHQLEALDLDASSAVHLQRLSPDASEQHIRNFLGGFDFSGDRAFEVIRHFSGGEKARLALAIVAWQKPNLLLLDEPTNHLDLEVRHALEIALQEFAGAIVVVSHDRHLLKNSVDSFVLVDDGRVTSFDGTLEDYHQWIIKRDKNSNKAKGETKQNKHTENKKTRVSPVQGSDKKEKRQQSAATREKLKPIKNTIKKLEKQIDNLQRELSQLETQLGDSDLYENGGSELESLLIKQAKARSELEKKEEDWMLKCEEYETLTANY